MYCFSLFCQPYVYVYCNFNFNKSAFIFPRQRDAACICCWAPCCGAAAAGRPAAAAVDRYLLSTRHSAANPPHAAPAVEWWDTPTDRRTDGRSTASQTLLHILCEQCKQDSIALSRPTKGWLGSRVVIVMDSGAEEPGFKSQSRRCRVTVLGKLFTPVVPLFTDQQNW